MNVKRARRWAVAALALGALSVVVSQYAVRRASRGRCHDDVAALPHRRAAVVLGTGRALADGTPNLYFTARIEAASALYRAGKADYLIVSGDNGRKEYDEPSDMKVDLISRGVPADRIYCDYAGFRTLDSMVRAGAIFGLTEFTVVSQRFHNERAIFLGRAHGLDVEAFNARDVAGAAGARMHLRESIARLAAVVDSWILRRGPRFYGPPVRLGLDPAPAAPQSARCRSAED